MDERRRVTLAELPAIQALPRISRMTGARPSVLTRGKRRPVALDDRSPQRVIVVEAVDQALGLRRHRAVECSARCGAVDRDFAMMWITLLSLRSSLIAFAQRRLRNLPCLERPQRGLQAVVADVCVDCLHGFGGVGDCVYLHRLQHRFAKSLDLLDTIR